MPLRVQRFIVIWLKLSVHQSSCTNQVDQSQTVIKSRIENDWTTDQIQLINHQNQTLKEDVEAALKVKLEQWAECRVTTH